MPNASTNCCFELLPGRAADFDAEGVAEEIVGAGVFVEPADEVADRGGEFVLPAGRGVEQHVLGELEEGTALVVGHAFEHFELDAVERLGAGGKHQAVGEREQVVRRDAEPDGREVLRPHAFGEHAQVVGVGFELRFVRRLRPAAQAGFDALHLHVRALHDADRDRRPALLPPACGPSR